MKRKDLLTILIPSFIFVILWIIFSIQYAINTPTISEKASMQITPISPNFDTKTIDVLKKRVAIAPIYDIAGASLTTQVLISAPTQQPSSPIISSSSASQASSGGSLLP